MNKQLSVVVANTPEREILSSINLQNDSVITLGNITNTVMEFVRSGVVRCIDGRYYYASQNDPMALSFSNLISQGSAFSPVNESSQGES